MTQFLFLEPRWSTGNTAKCRQMWAAGFSASEIAATLGPGFTRSAVMGKVHRERFKTPNSWGKRGSPARVTRETIQAVAP